MNLRLVAPYALALVLVTCSTADAQPQPDDPKAERVFDTSNRAAVANRPTAPSTFTLDRAQTILRIVTYHWNGGRGKEPGTIGLRDTAGRMHGPWQAVATPGYGDRPNCYWYVDPGVELPAGTYTVVDSDPATWSQNADSRHRGHVMVWALPEAVPPASAPAGRLIDTTAVLSEEEQEELTLLLRAIGEALGAELAVVLVGPMDDKEAALELCREAHNELVAAGVLPARQSVVLLYAGPGVIRAYSRKTDIDEAMLRDVLVAGWREAGDTPWPRKVIAQLQAVLRLAGDADPEAPATDPAGEPGAVAPHPAGQAAGELEAVVALTETLLRQGRLDDLLALSTLSIHQELERTLGQSPERMQRLADLLATRRLVTRDETHAEYQVKVDGLALAIRFTCVDGEWLLLSL